MNRQTQVSNVKVRTRAMRLEESITRPTEWKPKKTWGQKLLQLDRLARNLAVVAGLFLVVVAVHNTTTPEAQSVFGAIHASARMEWDDSLGKLSFVNSILPQSVRAVWQETPAIRVFSPVNGNVVHAWSQQEPYLLIDSFSSNVRASADGVVMSIAHGLNEERIVRLRHDDGTETLYGNLETCYAEVGDRLAAGETIGKKIEGQPLAFELRNEGRSINPAGLLLPFEE